MSKVYVVAAKRTAVGSCHKMYTDYVDHMRRITKTTRGYWKM